jgi:pimeloyl-ACP methyl ester carboxylesterase
MPVMKIDDFEMYYEIHGEKNEVPLVLIAGLGGDISTGWILQIPPFSKKYKVITFDNRDSGRTSQTDVSYTVDTFAEDTYNLLNKLGVNKAHILGGSMGGMIAQTFALNYPEMVRSLVLCSTMPQGFKWLSEITVWKELIKIAPRELFVEDILVWTLTRETLESKALIKMVIEQLVKYPYIQPPEAFIRQCNAIETFDVSKRLKEIKAPTLVVAGKRDILVPVWYSEEIASRIPNAELKVIQGCAHSVNLERAKEFNKTILEFLKQH